MALNKAQQVQNIPEYSLITETPNRQKMIERTEKASSFTWCPPRIHKINLGPNWENLDVLESVKKEIQLLQEVFSHVIIEAMFPMWNHSFL